MSDVIAFDSYRFATQMIWLGAILALLNVAVVVVGRTAYAIGTFRRRRIERRYEPITRLALEGDRAAQQQLASSPRRHRFYIARLLVMPLYHSRDPERVARTRAVCEAMSLFAIADHWLRSRFWWKRATALRVLGVLQVTDYTSAIVAALDDNNEDVRAAALDSLADLRDPESLGGLVARLHDESLHRGRRFAALAAFGPACEPFLLEMAGVDPSNRLDYARALRICGTTRSRPLLVGWTREPDADVRAAAYEALGHVGLDGDTVSLATAALEREDVKVRAMAAYALRDWNGSGDVARNLARHLDDQWPVAVRAARSLKTLGHSGIAALETAASRSDLAGELARQTLWEIGARR